MTTEMYDFIYLIDSIITILLKLGVLSALLMYFSGGINVSTWKKN